MLPGGAALLEAALELSNNENDFDYMGMYGYIWTSTASGDDAYMLILNSLNNAYIQLVSKDLVLMFVA